jgi:DNA-binding CsgD family transcriptional regulator
VEQFSLAAEAAAERGLTDPSQHFFLPDLAEALVLSGRVDEADAALQPFEERAEELNRAVQLAPAKRARAAIAEAEGEQTAAGQFLDAALELHEHFVDPFERARTLLARGSLRRRQRRRREGRSDVEAALEIFDELGAPLWAARAREELAQFAGRAPSSNALTPAEERIAALVAAGKSNAEVANALFLSPKTVEWNLSKVYKKLHVTSRTELAAKLAKR